MPAVNVAILTVSDRCSCGEAEDKSGPALKKILLRQGFVVLKEDCVPDEANLIEEGRIQFGKGRIQFGKGLIHFGKAIDHWTYSQAGFSLTERLGEWSQSGSHITVVLTTGGTGFAPRDVTPEATLRVVERLCPAITTAMTVASLNVTPMAMLSRSISGIKNSTLIVNLPGSVKGATECLETVLPCLQHASDLLRDSKSLVEQTHSSMNQLSVGMLRSKVNDLKVTARERISPWPLVSMDDATKIVMNSVCVMETTSLPLSDALGYVTSKGVVAVDNLPPFRASVKDGYAVHSSSGTGVFKVVSALTAGCLPEGVPELREKECVRVNTGGPVPLGADAVVQVEDTTLVEADGDGNEILIDILKEAVPNQDIRPVGCDIARGEVVLPIYTEIRSAEHGILAAAGASVVPVFRKPVVAVLSTGNELVPATKDLQPGTVWDSNMTTLRSLLTENGFQSHDMGIARDQPDILLRDLKRSLTVADVVITTGSVSMGEKDHLKDVLKLDLGANIMFGRVNMKPGKPSTFAVLSYNGKTKFVFALPGNPASATVMTHLLVLPALKKMSGHQSPLPTSVSAIMDFDVKLDDRPEYRRAILHFSRGDGCLRAKSTGTQISSRLLSWRHANCLLVLPSKNEVPNGEIPKGQKVQALIVDKLL